MNGGATAPKAPVRIGRLTFVGSERWGLKALCNEKIEAVAANVSQCFGEVGRFDHLEMALLKRRHD